MLWMTISDTQPQRSFVVRRCEKSEKEMTRGSTASSTFCSQGGGGSELELFFTAYTSFFQKVRRSTVRLCRSSDEQIDLGKQQLTVGEIQQKVKDYNAQINSNLYMVVSKDGSYTGFIKVHFKLVRPISLPSPQAVCSTEEGDQRCGPMKRRTSFYLPKDAAKHLHISSKTRVREVIEALLNKFTVVDNPAKFALFERSERQSQVYLRKLSDDECPLFLRLCAGPNEKLLSLVLKENETGDVNWHAFSFPELCNFLRILKREEEEHVRQIVKRYAVARDKMKQAMERITTPG
ncbi:ras association domain-containing protein 1 isoform X2 [Genypterus blacodes]|uniref:ras association domain-containing protein 1 isoform X2 n=1 Tax=Genypterus blacodes TaxID=154954 RepID=UPI003F76770C